MIPLEMKDVEFSGTEYLCMSYGYITSYKFEDGNVTVSYL